MPHKWNNQGCRQLMASAGRRALCCWSLPIVPSLLRPTGHMPLRLAPCLGWSASRDIKMRPLDTYHPLPSVPDTGNSLYFYPVPTWERFKTVPLHIMLVSREAQALLGETQDAITANYLRCFPSLHFSPRGFLYVPVPRKHPTQVACPLLFQVMLPQGLTRPPCRAQENKGCWVH